MVKLIRSDLEFILEQIRIAEANAAGTPLIDLLPNVQVPWGLRTVKGVFNNLVLQQGQFGAADNVFPRLLDPVFRTAETKPANFFFPGDPAGTTPTSYLQTHGNVYDTQPRVISNLIVDQTDNNPAAVAARDQNGDGQSISSPGLDGIFGTADDHQVNYMPNEKPDFALTAPFNAWMTFFGQFFDHGLDLVTKGGNDKIFIPLNPDDPLYVPGAPTNFMVETRATMMPGPDGILGTDDDIHENQNTTSPFIDQNQTYTSHPSHQVFLRAYQLIAEGADHHLAPVATGKLIENRHFGADGKFGTADDSPIGGMATWEVVKAQARDLLGINLTDKDFDNVPLLATDEYGNFIKGAHGLPQVVMKGADGIAGTADDVLIEGNLAAPIDLTNAVRTGHQFLIDVNDNAVPVIVGGVLQADADNIVGNAQPRDAFGNKLTYDDELLNAHYIAGDGRVNENIGLTAVHSIFHSEHNRLVDQAKAMVQAELTAGDVAFAQDWVLPGVTLTAGHIITDTEWNGERLFATAKFGTEMQYQHLVFEEFARTVQPNVDEFLAPLGYNTLIDPSIVAEFAHTVYRFGHSMLTETVDRYDANFNVVSDPNTANPDDQLGLIAAFLNPLAFAASGPTPAEATGAIVRGTTRTVGNEIDEFVTEALRNNLLGTPLDLAVLNIARARDTGVPSLQSARRTFYHDTGDINLKPYLSWSDLAQNLRHPESIINFVAAYGKHESITSAVTVADKRAAATALVLGDSNDADGTTINGVTYFDRLAFLNATGLWADADTTHTKDLDGVSRTGLGDIDFWIGGLAERQMPFGGLLGSTFMFVFENQLEALQNGDRFYYLARTAGLNFGTELENTKFSQLIMLNTDAKHLPADVFEAVAYTLEVDKTKQFTGLGADGRDDPTGGIMIAGHEMSPLVIRVNPNDPADAHYLHYNGYLQNAGTVVLGGTEFNDTIIAGDSDDDTVYGDGGNDNLNGGAGDDQVFGGDGDDIIQDPGGTDVLHGDAGNDVIVDSHMHLPLEVPNIILGGDGKDFIVTPDDVSTIFGGTGDDFILGSKPNLPETGNEGDDWIETGTQDGAPGDNFSPLLLDDVPGNDIFIGGGGFDEMIGEGGDDVFVGSDAQDKMDGMSGFDWVTYKSDKIGVTVDLELAALNEPPVAASPASILDRFAEVEGLGGSAFADYLRGSEADANVLATFNAKTSALTNISLVHGLQGILDHAFVSELAGLSPLGDGNLAAGGHITQFGSGNIILAGSGSDIILPRGGDDLVDGDAWFNVRISVRANNDGTGAEIASYDSMVPLVPLMLNRTYNPGQLVAVREVLQGAADFDTVVFQGARAEYTIDFNDRGTADRSDDVITVTDNSAKPRDGVDRLTHIERLQFADQQVDFYPNLDKIPTGTLVLNDLTSGTATFSTGDLVNVSIAGVHDVDNISATNPTGAISGEIRYTWQSEQVAGSGVFDDITLLPGGDLAFESASGKTFQLLPLVDGLRIRVKAIYTDAHGVTEQVFSAPTTAVNAIAQPLAPLPPAPSSTDNVGGEGIKLVRSDLDFILKQIKIGEAHAAGTPLQDLIPNIRLAYGLRAVDGSENNLLQTGGFNQTEFGAADNTFPRLLPPHLSDAEKKPADFFFPGDPAGTTNTSYTQTTGNVFDSQPRTISNLIVDQTANNPAAVAAAAANGGAHLVTSPGLDGVFGTADDKQVYEIPNVKPDFGLTAPFNAWMTFFGQFFDHGLDLVTKGGNGKIFVPLKPDDPLYVAGSPTNFMIESRATITAVHPGPDGVLGTSDDIHDNENTTTPFVDQNQTYTSHPSHQVFLRAYQLVVEGADNHLAPVATGKLIEGRGAGADGVLFTADDDLKGGMATWEVVKAQARDFLGINLTDKDFDNVPLLATDQYGNFIKGAHGLPQVVMATAGADGLFNTADDGTTLIEGNLAAPLDLTHAVRTGHQFLIDVNDNAAPVLDAAGNLKPDDDTIAGNAQPRDAFGNKLTYDDELLNAHYIAGDGRVNENIGLTTVHAIFHSEHNRLVDQAKETILNSNDLAFLKEWVLNPGAVTHMPTTQAEIDSIIWDGERLFQVAKFGTEMQYQHLVFEEFARTVQPLVDPFFAPTQVYDVNLDPSIVAEFAHTVYRFGHSMLTETVDRFDANFNVVGDPNSADPDQQLGLIAAFLNPLAFAASGETPEDAASAIVRGTTRTVGNEIDEFVTEALRNNLLGTPLDLAVLNLARGRDVGIPSLNAARRDFYTQTGDIWVKPYSSWVDLMQNIKHPESIINFIAAYGVHNALLAADVDTLAEKRAVATALVLGGSAIINAGGVGGVEHVFTADEADRNAFLNSTGIYANAASGVTTTGVDNIDFWIGGLAERQMPFGGLLGSTFNFVFENQLEKLQDGDRFYYLERTSGMAFGNEIEFNSFAKMIMANTNAVHLPGNVFMTPGFTLEVDQSKQYTGLGVDGRDDPTGGVTIGSTELSPLVIRDNPDTIGPDTNYLHYAGVAQNAATVVLGGTAGNDILIAGDSDDDTVYGDGGNDRLDGGYGDDFIRGGDGDDIIQDRGGTDEIHGDDGNDVIQAGSGSDLIYGGFGKDFIFTGEDNSEAFGGQGDDFILGNTSNEQDIGNEGDDWLEHGTSDGAPGDNFDPLGLDPVIGNDIFIGDGENDKFIGEGGDDIMVGSPGLTDRYFGGSGFDWATFKDDAMGVTIDIDGRFFDQPQVPGSDASSLARFDIMEGLSGSKHDDYLRGDDATDLIGGEVGGAPRGSALTNIALIDGLQQLLNALAPGGPNVTQFTTGNILLSGAGSDILEGRAGDDRIDGDAWLNVRISVRANQDGTGAEIATFDSMIPLIPYMMDGTYHPGQLVAVREILYAPGGETDTAKFSSNRADYTIAVDGVVVSGTSFSVNPNSIITVTDNVGTDGTDTLTHIERLQFADGYIVSATNNHQPLGALTFDHSPAEGVPITVSIAGVTDADNVSATNAAGHINGTVSYFWQQETKPGVYQDITVFAAGEIARVEGKTFTPAQADVGTNIRVRAVYIDDKGTLEEVFSTPQTVANVDQPAVGAPTISDTTPTEAIAITASTAGITDPDGLTAATFAFQWQQAASAAGPFTNIAGATGLSFTPRAAQVLQVLRVVVTVTDDLGGVTVLNSVPTGNVGDHIIGNGAGNTLNGTAFDDWIEGNGGNDNLNGGAGSDLIDGGAGNDTLNGNDGDDTLIGGAGADVLNGGAGNDINAGGTGNDTYIIDDAGDSVTENAGEGTDLVQTSLAACTLGANVENLTFTGAGNFAGTGNALANTIQGGAGADTLSGLDGNDTLQGNAGDDTLSGGAGVDTLTGGAGNDSLNGGAGNDTLNGGGGNDTASYAGETDAFFVNLAAGTARRGAAASAVEDTYAGIENATGGAGNDTLGGDGGANVLDGGAGNDTLNGQGGADTLLGGGGADVINGGAGNDNIDAGAGNDTITCVIGDGTDTINGGADTDTLNVTGGAGADTLTIGFNGALNSINGGAVSNIEIVNVNLGGGNDTLSYAGNAAAITVMLGGSASGLTSVAGVENVTGGNGNDTLNGDGGANTLNSGAGNDTLNGGGGNDTLIGGAGDDTYIVNAAGNVAITEAAGGGTDTVFTNRATFTLANNVENLTYTGAASFTGTGNGGANIITGGNANDALSGGAGNDTLIGGAGNDNLDGGADNDTLNGGAGNDTMNGGTGNDVFIFGPHFGADTITGFDANPTGGQDFLNVHDLGITAATFAAHVSIQVLGANTLVTIDGTDTINLLAVGAGQNIITQADFIF